MSTGTLVRNQEGAITGNAATRFDGLTGLVVAQQSQSSPKTYSAELWFKTTSIQGGKLIGFGNATSGLSSSYDRHVYMQSNGRLSFGANSGGQQSLVTPIAYNDGQWHHVVATQGPSGMRLWVDSALVGSNAVNGAQSYLGYWRVGGDRTWGSTLSNYIAGTLDEVAVYPKVLTEQDVREHYTAAGRSPLNRPPVAAFTATMDDLKVNLDASASTDPDGPVSYAWDFGDGATGTGADDKSHLRRGRHLQVELTVTDGPGLVDTETHSVTVVANQPPTADFNTEVDDLELSVDAAASARRRRHDRRVRLGLRRRGDGVRGHRLSYIRCFRQL